MQGFILSLLLNPIILSSSTVFGFLHVPSFSHRLIWKSNVNIRKLAAEPVIPDADTLNQIAAAHSTPRRYISHTLESSPVFRYHIHKILDSDEGDCDFDFLWEQVKLEAQLVLNEEPAAGPQLYTLILSQPSLIRALINIISLEVETELMPATAIQRLFIQMLDPEEDRRTIQLDVIAAATRPSSHSKDALTAILFDKGLHALICHRVSHRLWLAKRTGLAYYMQSTVSRVYSADLHPAAKFGAGVYLNAGGGVVIGETAVVGDDVTILQGVTLGGTGKERGDRHPKVGKGVVLNVGAIVLGNIPIGDFSIIFAKSLVNKPVPPGALVSGIPGRVQGYRTL